MSGDDLLAYCGLDRSACFSYTRTISEAARVLRHMMRNKKIKQVWPGMTFRGEYAVSKEDFYAPAGSAKAAATAAAIHSAISASAPRNLAMKYASSAAGSNRSGSWCFLRRSIRTSISRT